MVSKARTLGLNGENQDDDQPQQDARHDDNPDNIWGLWPQEPEQVNQNGCLQQDVIYVVQVVNGLAAQGALQQQLNFDLNQLVALVDDFGVIENSNVPIDQQAQQVEPMQEGVIVASSDSEGANDIPPPNPNENILHCMRIMLSMSSFL